MPLSLIQYQICCLLYIMYDQRHSPAYYLVVTPSLAPYTVVVLTVLTLSWSISGLISYEFSFLFYYHIYVEDFKSVVETFFPKIAWKCA